MTPTRLQWRLPLAIAGLLLLVAGGMAALTYWQARSATIEAAETRQRELVGQLAANVGANTRTLRQQTAALASRPDVQNAARHGNQEGLKAAFDALLQQSTQGAGYALWTGRDAPLVRVETDDAPPANDDWAQYPDWASDADPVMSPPRLAGGAGVFVIAAPVVAEGARVGVLTARRLMGGPTTSSQMVADLIGPGSRLLAGRPGSGWIDLGHGTAVGSAGATPDGRAYRVSDAGVTYFGVTGPIADSGWSMRIERPWPDVIAPAQRLLWRLMAITGGVLLVGVAGGWWLSRSLMGPLLALTRAAEAMAAGEPAGRLAWSRRDEIGRLAGAFNTMAASVASARRNLEQRVEERTEALSTALARLAASEAQFRNVASTAPVAIVIADDSGRIQFVNAATETMFGYREPELVGESLSVLMPRRLRAAHQAGMQRFADTGTSRIIGRSVELVGQRHSGEEFPLELSLGHWRDGGRPMFAGIIRDLSTTKASEEALHEYARALERSNRDLEAFSYTISHDLRAPLRSIDGFSEALEAEYASALPPEAVGYLTRVRRAAKRMDLLINDLLDLAKVSRVELLRQPIDLGRIAGRLIADLRERHPDRVVEITIADGLTAHGDPRLMTLVLQNLIENAWKFTRARVPARIEIARAPEAGPGTVVVRDNGVGFDMAHAGKLFGIFQRLHSLDEFPGTGVGLAIVQRVLERHGGRVWADARPDEGAAFYFTLEREALMAEG